MHETKNGGYPISRRMILVVVSALITAGLFYFTPLKHIALIEPKMDDISAVDFYALYTQNPDEYLFIDVRSVEEFNAAHAEGSVNMPLHTLFDQRKNLPKSGKEIVLICSGGRASGVGYGYLEHYGFLNLKRIKGGIQEWRATDLPVVF